MNSMAPRTGRVCALAMCNSRVNVSSVWPVGLAIGFANRIAGVEARPAMNGRTSASNPAITALPDDRSKIG